MGGQVHDELMGLVVESGDNEGSARWCFGGCAMGEP